MLLGAVTDTPQASGFLGGLEGPSLMIKGWTQQEAA